MKKLIPIFIIIAIVVIFISQKDPLKQHSFLFQASIFEFASVTGIRGASNYFYTQDGKEFKYQSTFIQLITFESDASKHLITAACDNLSKNNYHLKSLSDDPTDGYYFAGKIKNIPIKAYRIDIIIDKQPACLFYLTTQGNDFDPQESLDQASAIIIQLKLLFIRFL